MDRQRNAQPTKNVAILTDPVKYMFYMCTICMKFPMQPIQATPTGHRYCKTCFLAKICPGVGWMCGWCLREHIREDDRCEKMAAFFPDKGAMKDIDKLPSKCRTCDFVAPMKEMEEHVHIRG